jgi:broad specificity phosphatase PhoE
MNSTRKLFLIRHAQSEHNVLAYAAEAKGEDELAFKFSEHLIDCNITEFGVQQTLSAKEAVKDINITQIIVSPLRRALRTCYEIFKDHKNKPKVVVWPWAREILESACDIPDDLEKIKSEFPDYDFSEFDKLQNKDMWLLETLVNEKELEILGSVKEHIQPHENQGAIFRKLLAKKLSEQWPKTFDKGLELLKRTEIVKERMKTVLDTMPKDERLCFVGHSAFLLRLVSTKFNEEWFPIDGEHFSNCEVREHELV